MRVTYGYQVKSADDSMLTIPLQSLRNFSEISRPGAFLVDQIPARKHTSGSVDDNALKWGSVQYLPRWMPGSGFLDKVDAWHQMLMDSCWVPYQWSKTNIVSAIEFLRHLLHMMNLFAH